MNNLINYLTTFKKKINKFKYKIIRKKNNEINLILVEFINKISNKDK